ncbi:glutathione S-transferase family protein [Sphingorhabdus sp.]|uniref:glutathione S-transferase family protein n=1 Tax=Sphingorhabdus sp. TaxID=1902408 RepID=UPI0032B8795C
MTDPLILHEDPISGNCYKIRLTASLLGISLERRTYDIRNGETRSPEFLRSINANGRIPVLQIGDRFLPESNAACYWLAEGSDLIPSDRFDHAEMLRWLFFEQYSHEPNIATLRFWLAYIGKDNLDDTQLGQINSKTRSGQEALRVMDAHLVQRDWFAGTGLSIADIALFAYTHVAEEGAIFSLDDHPAICRWMARISDEPGFVPMKPGDH